MKLQLVDFHGFIKWLVTEKVLFVDPLYLEEVSKKFTIDKKIDSV